jgi:uncharacterized membrane protein (UPF0127 family)
MKHELPIMLEIADNDESRRQGLMFRKSLPDDYGMMFVFDKPDVLKFWGMNTLIPLDICFMDEDFKILSMKKIKQHDLSSVSSDLPCRFALEVNDGLLKRKGISVGDRLNMWQNGKTYFINKEELKKEAQDKGMKANEDDQELMDEIIEEDIKKKENNKLKVIPTEKFEDTPKGKLLVDNTKLNKPNLSKDRANKLLERRLNKNYQRYPKFQSFFDALKWAFQNNEVIKINYTCLSGFNITRDVEPHGVFKSRKSGRQVLITYDRNVNAPRSFIIMNVKNYSFIGRKYNKKFIFI